MAKEPKGQKHHYIPVFYLKQWAGVGEHASDARPYSQGALGQKCHPGHLAQPPRATPIDPRNRGWLKLEIARLRENISAHSTSNETAPTADEPSIPLHQPKKAKTGSVPVLPGCSAPDRRGRERGAGRDPGDRQTIYRIKDDPAATETALTLWGL